VSIIRNTVRSAGLVAVLTCSAARTPQAVPAHASQVIQEEQERVLQLAHAKIDPSREWDAAATLFGISVANLGDNDGDGEEEIAVGAPKAWTEAGRTGAVLILGAKTGRLLHLIKGKHHSARFAWNLRAVSEGATSKGTRLAIGVDGRVRFLDTKSWTMTSEEELIPDPLLLPLDYDGDGHLDRIREPEATESEMVILSGVDGRELRRLGSGGAGRFDVSRSLPLVADFDGDGRKDVAAVWPDFSANTSQIVCFSGRSLEKRRSIPLLVEKSPNVVMDREWRCLFTCGDLNGDGCDELLSADPCWVDAALTCYSGSDGSTLWTNEDAVVEESASIDRIRDLDGDGVTDLISGKVLYLPSGIQYGENGQVVVVSGKSGRTLKTFDERNYHAISLHFYRFGK